MFSENIINFSRESLPLFMMPVCKNNNNGGGIFMDIATSYRKLALIKKYIFLCIKIHFF